MIVYLTGGIGTGKSTVLQIFAALGAVTLSADAVVSELYSRSEVQAQVSAALDLPVPLDKAAVAELVFRDTAARRRLEAVLHPLVAEGVARFRAAADAVVVYEIPLLPRPEQGDVVVAVTCPLDIRLRRLQQRGLTEADALARISAQPSPEEYGKQALYTIVNDGNVSALRASVQTVWEELQRGATTI